MASTSPDSRGPLDILVVTGRFPLLSQSFIERKVVGLARRGHRVTVLAGGRGDHELDAGRPASLRVEYVPEGRTLARLAALSVGAVHAARRSPRFALGLAWALRNGDGRGRRLELGLRLAGRRADVVHFEWSATAARAVDVLDLLAVPTVVSCRGSDVRILPLGDDRLAAGLRRLFATVDAVHCVSGAVQESAVALGLDPGRAFVNHPAVDASSFSPDGPAPPAPPLRIVSVGRIHWVKGYEHALQAVRLLLDRGCDVRYTIAGGGDAAGTGAVRFAAHDLGVADHVTFAGPRPPAEVRALLAGAHVFVLPSLSEGLSNAALEAMAMERPVVVSDVGGMRELVRDGVDGFLVPARDPAALADCVERLAADPALRARLGAAGRQRVRESFAFDDQIDRFVDRYHALARGHA